MTTYVEPLTYRDGAKRVHVGLVRDLERALEGYSAFVAAHTSNPLAGPLGVTARHIEEELQIRFEREKFLGRS